MAIADVKFDFPDNAARRPLVAASAWLVGGMLVLIAGDLPTAWRILTPLLALALAAISLAVARARSRGPSLVVVGDELRLRGFLRPVVLDRKEVVSIGSVSEQFGGRAWLDGKRYVPITTRHRGVQQMDIRLGERTLDHELDQVIDELNRWLAAADQSG